MSSRRALVLALGPAAAASLAVASLLGLSPLLRAPLFVVGVLWAPGDLLLRALRREMHPIERVACAVAIGLFLLPVVGLSLSALHALRGAWIGLVYAVLDGALALAAARRRLAVAGGLASDLPLAPNAAVTFAVSGGALLVAGAVFALPLFESDGEAPLAIGLVGPDGTTESLPYVLVEGEIVTLRAIVLSGDEPREGELIAVVRSPGGTVETTLARLPLELDAGERRELDLQLPPLTEGQHVLSVAWTGDEPRETHLTLYVERARR